jgi:hypothetical protein
VHGLREYGRGGREYRRGAEVSEKRDEGGSFLSSPFLASSRLDFIESPTVQNAMDETVLPPANNNVKGDGARDVIEALLDSPVTFASVRS